MGIDRREFLKFGGLAAALGAGAFSVVDSVLAKGAQASSPAHEEEAAPSSKLRYGMVIDVRKLSGPEAYRKCIDACHSIHNVPDLGNKKDEIKWIWEAPFVNAFPSKSHQFMSADLRERPFLLFCNHCQNPPCVRVCPTKATFKRPEDGIVMMDYHRCIGCRFCMAGCPYGVRSFNWRDPRPFIKELNVEYPTRERGVVEKCNFCAERLAVGKQPACVEASGGALVFGNLNDTESEIRQVLAERTTIQRKPELGTNPSLFYIV